MKSKLRVGKQEHEKRRRRKKRGKDTLERQRGGKKGMRKITRRKIYMSEEVKRARGSDGRKARCCDKDDCGCLCPATFSQGKKTSKWVYLIGGMVKDDW